ncbi:MAG: hypothetical protein ACRCZP_12340, partial [Phycicoccus sp.]
MAHEYVGATLGRLLGVGGLTRGLVPDADFHDVGDHDSLVTESWVFGGHEKVRWYLTSSATPLATVPYFTAGTAAQNWEDSSQAAKGALATTPAGTSTLVTAAETSTSNTHDVALGQWVSGPATRDGEISGGVVGDLVLMHARAESDLAADLQTRYMVYVVDSTGAVVRPGFLSRIGNVEPGTALTGHQITGTTNTAQPIFVQPGDRLVVEVGYRATNTAATAYSGSMRYGGTGTPLADGDTGVTAERPPWIELTGPYLAGLFTDPAPAGGAVDLAGVSAAAAGQGATLGRARDVAGASTAASQMAATTARARPLDAAAAAVGEASGTPSRTRDLAAGSSAAAAQAAVVDRARPLDAAAGGVTHAGADLTVDGGVTDLAGTSAATAGQAGAVGVDRPVAATSGSAAAQAGALGRSRPLDAAAAAAAQQTGSVGRD